MEYCTSGIYLNAFPWACEHQELRVAVGNAETLQGRNKPDSNGKKMCLCLNARAIFHSVPTVFWKMEKIT